MKSVVTGFVRSLGPWALILSAAVFWGVLIDWTGPLTELHDFRQSQTALSIYWMIRDGIDFLRPALPVFGIEQPSAPLEFPVFQAVVAGLAKLTGENSVAAVIFLGRLTTFACYLLTARILYALVLRAHDRRFAVVVTALFLMMPFPVLWSSAVTIEFLALLLTLLYLQAVYSIAQAQNIHWSCVLIGALAGAGAMLVKITTVLVYGPALLFLWYLWLARERRNHKLDFRALRRVGFITIAVAVVPALAGLGWVLWTDHVKLASPLTYFLTSSGSSDWTYGSLSDRLSTALWAKIGIYWILQIYAVVGAPLAVLGAWRLWKSDKVLFTFWALPLVTAPLVFFSLYQHHNYYHIAILPGLLVFLVSGVTWLSDRLKTAWPEAKRDALVLGGIAFLGWACLAAQTAIAGYRTPHEMLSALRIGPHWASPTRQRDMEMVRLIRAYSKPGDVVMIAKEDWSSIVTLYAERRSLMALSCDDIEQRPKIDLYIVDRRRALCKSMTVPQSCSLSDTDDLSIGTCIQVGP